MKKAILMARVSSDEQAKGYSLDIQVEKLLVHCRKENISVINIYKEDHSAKDFNRPEFKKMLHYLAANKGKVDYVLFVTWDRFSRNITESYAMINRLKNYGVEVQAIEQHLDLTIPENQMILSVYLALPDIDNRRRSIKITEGVRAGQAAGRWLRVAPFGYVNASDEQKKPIIVPDKKAAIVKRIFTEIASGKTQAEVRYQLNKEGILISKSAFSRILRNRVYIGQIHVKGVTQSEGYYVKGLHEAIIPETLFNKVQEKIEDNFSVKKLPKAKAFRPELYLRGLINCDNCHKPLTGSASRSKTGKKHFYYHCNHCNEVRIAAAEIHKRVELILEEIKLKKGVKNLFELILKKQLSRPSRKRTVEQIENEIRQLEERIINTEDKLADGQIIPSVFNSIINRYRGNIIQLQAELSDYKENNIELSKNLKKGIELISNLGTLYVQSDIYSKKRIVSSIFPENLIFSKKNCRTPRLNEALRLILNVDKGSEENKKGQLFKNLELSRQVELQGIEPWSKHIRRKLSTCLFVHYLSGNSRSTTNQLFP